MIVRFQMLLSNSWLKLKYSEAMCRGRVKPEFNTCPYVVEVNENILKIRPLLSYECGVEQWVWHSRYDVLGAQKNEPFPEQVEVIYENDMMHLIICALLQKLDFDSFIKGLKLECRFDKPPVKYIQNYLTGGLVFRELTEDSYDGISSLGEFLHIWTEVVMMDISYQNFELETPSTLVGRLKVK